MALAPSAEAAILWSWTFAAPTSPSTLNPGSGSGTLKTVDTPDGNGNFLVTAITGSFTGLSGGASISLLPPNSVGFEGNDNLISGSGQLIDNNKNGIGFTVGSGLNYYMASLGSSVGDIIVQTDPFIANSSPSTFSATQGVPEPLTLMGASAAIAFGAAFKRRRAQAKANLDFIGEK